MSNDEINTLTFYIVLIGCIVGGGATAFALWFIGML